MLRFFTSDLRRNLTKILCLTVGLSVGFLLVAKVYFEQTFDAFLPDIDRLYLLTESIDQNGEYIELTYTPGGTIQELKRNFPQIVKATRIDRITGKTVIKLEDGRMFDVENITLADTCLFDVLQTQIIEGNPHEVLDIEDHVMIPRSLAEKIGGNVIGLQIVNTGYGDNYKQTIGGVYEDFPLNSTIHNSVYLSMLSIGKFEWDSRENLIGNDVFESYAILHDGINLDEFHTRVMDLLKEKIPVEAFTMQNYHVWFRPVLGRYASKSSVKTMSWMLSLLAVIILMCTALNYLLIVIGQLAVRSKEMAIRKCYGTSFQKLFVRVIGESLFFLAVSLGLAVLVAFSFSDLFGELLGYTPRQLFSTPKVWFVEGLVCLGILVVTGIIPSVIYSRTPVGHAFRPSSKARKGWKLVLLAVQFFASGLIMCILVLVARQYNMIVNLGMGFDYENIGIFRRNGLSDERTASIIAELRQLPFIEGVATSNYNMAYTVGGNNVWMEGMEDNQVNVADMYDANPELLDVLGIKMLQGRNLRTDADSTINEVIVEERFIDVMRKAFGFEGSDIVGQTFYITGHADRYGRIPEVTIVGVFDNLRRGGYETERVDTRAGVIFPSTSMHYWVYVRFTELTPENLKAAQDIIENLKENNEVNITPYKNEISPLRKPIERFGTSVLVVGIVIILIALIGLIGYVADEVNRRAKEIAIRKVNGTPAAKIVRLFCTDILKIALPSLLAGGCVAMIFGNRWLSQFTDRVSLSPLSMALCLLVLMLLITGVVIINSLRIARSNPVDHLRSE